MLYAETGLTPNPFVYQDNGAACALGVLARWLGFDGASAQVAPGIDLGKLYRNITAGELGVPQSWMRAYERGVFAATSDRKWADGLRRTLLDDEYPIESDEHAAALRGYDAWTTVLADREGRS